MEYLARTFFKIVFEIMAYNIGYYLWFIVPTKIKVEPIAKQKSRSQREIFSFTYKPEGTKYLYHDANVLFGLLVLFNLGVLAYSIMGLILNSY